MIDPRFRYGTEQHAFYEDNGYCLFDHFLSEQGLAECRKQIDTMIDEHHTDVPPEMMINTHQYLPWVFELATQPKLLDMIETQIGRDILLYSSHLLSKPPRTGQPVPWHQDSPYWNVKGRFSAGVWIALDDIDEENGAMSVIAGWHRKGTLPIQPSQFVKGFNQEIVPSALPPNINERKVVYRLKAGQMAIHHVMIPHNSPPNKSDRWRRVIVLRYLAADGALGPNTYHHYRTSKPFNREFFLVRGEDVQGLGLRHSPLATHATT